jgi:hypothetical protein
MDVAGKQWQGAQENVERLHDEKVGAVRVTVPSVPPKPVFSIGHQEHGTNVNSCPPMHQSKFINTPS